MASGRSDSPGDVLAQPTRARLFAHLASLGPPAGTNELAAELRLHPSGVRVHLERLRARDGCGSENQPVVCELHRGLTRCLLDQLDPVARLAAFVPEDPDRAGCLIEVAGFQRS